MLPACSPVSWAWAKASPRLPVRGVSAAANGVDAQSGEQLASAGCGRLVGEVDEFGQP